jgi:hypothetical protein
VKPGEILVGLSFDERRLSRAQEVLIATSSSSLRRVLAEGIPTLAANARSSVAYQ